MSELQLKEGRHYVNRRGEVKGPLYSAGEGPFAFCTHNKAGDPDWFYFADGRVSQVNESSLDLVAEYTVAKPEVTPLFSEMDAPAPAVDTESLAASVAALSEAVDAASDGRSQIATAIAKGGRKDDAGKARFDLIAPEMLFGIATILDFGARKYAPRNWEVGMAWGRCFGAMMRHMWAWWGGAGPTTKSFLFGDLDEETGFSHLWHAGCCLMFLIAYEERKTGTDDRLQK